MKNIAVYLSANDVVAKYTNPAKELAGLLVDHGYCVIYGGSEKGLMKIVADEVVSKKGKLIGISMKGLDVVARRKNIDEIIIASTLGERKELFSSKADGFVILPGGMGTLDEVTEVLEHKKHNRHHKPVIFLNTAGYWDYFKKMLEHMVKEGFLNVDLNQYAYFCDTPQEAVEHLKATL